MIQRLPPALIKFVFSIQSSFVITMPEQSRLNVSKEWPENADWQPWRTAHRSGWISETRLGGLQGALQLKVSRAVFEDNDGYQKNSLYFECLERWSSAQKYSQTLLSAHAHWAHNWCASVNQAPYLVPFCHLAIHPKPDQSPVCNCWVKFSIQKYLQIQVPSPQCQPQCLPKLWHLVSLTKGSVCLPQNAWLPHSDSVPVSYKGHFCSDKCISAASCKSI